MTDARRGGGLLYAIVFVSGIASVGTQIAASRLVAPYFGNSTDIWAVLIGLTLTYLSLGYYLGGRIADRYPRATLLYTLTVVAAIAIGGIPLIGPPLLDASLNTFAGLPRGAFYGALLAVFVIFLVPITLLGCVSPMAIRLRVQAIREAGKTAGAVYALSTVGAIVGSFLPVLVLIPYLGTAETFYTFALLLGGISLAALLLTRGATMPG